MWYSCKKYSRALVGVPAAEDGGSSPLKIILMRKDEQTMKSICVFCGSSDSVHADYISAAYQTGKLLAEKGIRLVYGGGKTGLMGAVANGAVEAGGQPVGCLIPSMNTVALAHIGLTR